MATIFSPYMLKLHAQFEENPLKCLSYMPLHRCRLYAEGQGVPSTIYSLYKIVTLTRYNSEML